MSTPPTPELLFAAVGDVHGQMHAMVRLLQGWEAKSKRSLSFVLQVGDFEPIRFEEDLDSLAAPAKYRKIGDFPDFFQQRARFPWPVYFIGGNHEPYGLLDTIPHGGRVIDHCTYLGRAEMVQLHGLRIAGLSGIFHAESFEVQRPGLAEMGRTSRKEFTYFRKDDVDRLANLVSVDILVVHEWPDRIIDPKDALEFEHVRRSAKYEGVGNEYARLLIDLLEPRLVLCGHMHKRYGNRIALESGKIATVRCLSHIGQGPDAVSIYRANKDGSLDEVWP